MTLFEIKSGLVWTPTTDKMPFNMHILILMVKSGLVRTPTTDKTSYPICPRLVSSPIRFQLVQFCKSHLLLLAFVMRKISMPFNMHIVILMVKSGLVRTPTTDKHEPAGGLVRTPTTDKHEPAGGLVRTPSTDKFRDLDF